MPKKPRAVKRKPGKPKKRASRKARKPVLTSKEMLDTLEIIVADAVDTIVVAVDNIPYALHHVIDAYSILALDKAGIGSAEGAAQETADEIVKRTIQARDREWHAALTTEFQIKDEIPTQDAQWVNEKEGPERWARLIRLVITPPDVKLHDYPAPEPVAFFGEDPT